jgi:hypothetical protein
MAKLKQVRALKSTGVEPLAPTLIKRILHVSHVVPYELARLRGFPGKRRARSGPQPSRTEEVPAIVGA